MGKLVRTRSLTAIGRTPRVTSLPAVTYRRALMDKLHEEVDELTAARSASGQRAHHGGPQMRSIGDTESSGPAFARSTKLTVHWTRSMSGSRQVLSKKALSGP